jgi:hypothetical protein
MRTKALVCGLMVAAAGAAWLVSVPARTDAG